jgi:hypothetical protein
LGGPHPVRSRSDPLSAALAQVRALTGGPVVAQTGAVRRGAPVGSEISPAAPSCRSTPCPCPGSRRARRPQGHSTRCSRRDRRLSGAVRPFPARARARRPETRAGPPRAHTRLTAAVPPPCRRRADKPPERRATRADSARWEVALTGPAARSASTSFGGGKHQDQQSSPDPNQQDQLASGPAGTNRYRIREGTYGRVARATRPRNPSWPVSSHPMSCPVDHEASRLS